MADFATLLRRGIRLPPAGWMLAAMLAFVPLTQSVFWGKLAYTLIGGTFAGTVLTLVFLPALYAIWVKIRPAPGDEQAVPALRTEAVPA